MKIGCKFYDCKIDIAYQFLIEFDQFSGNSFVFKLTLLFWRASAFNSSNDKFFFHFWIFPKVIWNDRLNWLLRNRLYVLEWNINWMNYFVLNALFPAFVVCFLCYFMTNPQSWIQFHEPISKSRERYQTSRWLVDDWKAYHSIPLNAGNFL